MQFFSLTFCLSLFVFTVQTRWRETLSTACFVKSPNSPFAHTWAECAWKTAHHRNVRKKLPEPLLHRSSFLMKVESGTSQSSRSTARMKNLALNSALAFKHVDLSSRTVPKRVRQSCQQRGMMTLLPLPHIGWHIQTFNNVLPLSHLQ